MTKINIKPFSDKSVKQFFDRQEPNYKTKLLFLRNFIYETANELDEVENLIESLKWGEPSYVPSKSNIGSPIRINRIKNSNKYALYFNCQSKLIPTFKEIYPDSFNYQNNRAIVFNLGQKIPNKKLKHCISIALTYHLNKNSLNPFNNK